MWEGPNRANTYTHAHTPHTCTHHTHMHTQYKWKIQNTRRLIKSLKQCIHTNSSVTEKMKAHHRQKKKKKVKPLLWQLCSHSVQTRLVEFLPEVLLALLWVLEVLRVVCVPDEGQEAGNGTLLVQYWYQYVLLAVCIGRKDACTGCQWLLTVELPNYTGVN